MEHWGVVTRRQTGVCPGQRRVERRGGVRVSSQERVWVVAVKRQCQGKAEESL